MPAAMDTIMVVPGAPGDPARKVAVRRYFRLTPRHSEEMVARAFIGFGGFLALVALACWAVAAPVAFGAICGTVAVVSAVHGVQEAARYRNRRRKALPEPSDAAMDDLMARNIDEVAARAMGRLGLTDDMLVLHSDDVDVLVEKALRKPRLAAQRHGPLVIIGPVLTSPRRIGEDGVWRYARNVLMVICATDRHLGIYRCEVELAVGHVENEETHEYYYQDVVALQTVTLPWGPFSIIGPGGEYELDHVFGHEREMYIVVASAEQAHTVIGLREGGHPNHEIHLQETGIEYVIDVLRRLLRERKWA